MISIVRTGLLWLLPVQTLCLWYLFRHLHVLRHDVVGFDRRPTQNQTVAAHRIVGPSSKPSRRREHLRALVGGIGHFVETVLGVLRNNMVEVIL